MANKSLKLRPLVVKDLETIWEFSVESWGEQQAEAYIDGMFAAFDLIAGNPGLAPLNNVFNPPVRIHQHVSHLIVYVEGEQEVSVVRILRKSVLLSQHLEQLNH